MKTYDSVIFAKYLVAFAFSKGLPLNMTKLQKLLFIIYGHYLSKHNHKIINEGPKAWPFGPVFPRVHKKVDYTKISDLADPDFQEIRDDAQLNEILTSVVQRYAKFTATQLSNWSHMEGSPWDKTVKESEGKWNAEIPNEYISSYFSELQTI